MIPFVIPLLRVNWNTRGVLEGINQKYAPPVINIISVKDQISHLKSLSVQCGIDNVCFYDEDTFFQEKYQLTKKAICDKISENRPNYSSGWIYQQILKLGCNEVILDLPDWFLVWDSDLLPLDCWALTEDKVYKFALLQDKSAGNQEIVAGWSQWIQTVLQVRPVENSKSSFISHHMFFKQEHLHSLKERIAKASNQFNWIEALIETITGTGTMSEYWMYSSWVHANNPDDLNFYQYDRFGSTTERFFDDGTGLFSSKLKDFLQKKNHELFYPTYQEIVDFTKREYEKIPSSLSFENNPRHLKKPLETIHVEERRSKWNMRTVPPD